MKCNVCGHEFTPKREDRYEAVKPAPLFQCATHYDCFDCPVCGCQIVAQERYEDANKICVAQAEE